MFSFILLSHTYTPFLLCSKIPSLHNLSFHPFSSFFIGSSFFFFNEIHRARRTPRPVLSHTRLLSLSWSACVRASLVCRHDYWGGSWSMWQLCQNVIGKIKFQIQFWLVTSKLKVSGAIYVVVKSLSDSICKLRLLGYCSVLFALGKAMVSHFFFFFFFFLPDWGITPDCCWN